MPPKIWKRGLLNPPPESAIDVSHADTPAHAREHPWEGELTSDDETTLKSDHEITTTTTEPKELKIE